MTRLFVAVLTLLLLVGCGGPSVRGTPAQHGAVPPPTLPQESADSRPTATPAPTSIGSRSPSVAPRRILFIGNSLTHGGPVPEIVALFARSVGIDAQVTMAAESSVALSDHLHRQETLTLIDRGGWDAVVLQELSIRPTQKLGEPQRYVDSVRRLCERIQQASPGARLVLYETWALAQGSWPYPTYYPGPSEMQEDLRSTTLQTAVAVSLALKRDDKATLEVAPVGQLFEIYLRQPEALPLHSSDGLHASAAGKYLSALVHFSVLFQRSTLGLPSWQLQASLAKSLQGLVEASHDKVLRP